MSVAASTQCYFIQEEGEVRSATFSAGENGSCKVKAGDGVIGEAPQLITDASSLKADDRDALLTLFSKAPGDRSVVVDYKGSFYLFQIKNKESDLMYQERTFQVEGRDSKLVIHFGTRECSLEDIVGGRKEVSSERVFCMGSRLDTLSEKYSRLFDYASSRFYVYPIAQEDGSTTYALRMASPSVMHSLKSISNAYGTSSQIASSMRDHVWKMEQAVVSQLADVVAKVRSSVERSAQSVVNTFRSKL